MKAKLYLMEGLPGSGKTTFGVNRSLSGVEGTIAILQARQALERQLLKTLPFRVEVFGNEEFSVKARQAWVKQLI
ncbi:hypothetical protein [Exiguobacterium sp. PHA03]|uniref:hypothetical protein n=1 Tax=Exiguobacterium sp. PHA03 TaxID=3064895 RepID=UPI0035C07453